MASKNSTPTNTGYIISNPQHSGESGNLQLLRITVTNIEIKVDFGYQATSHYEKGGWIKISPQTFIRPKGTNKKFILTNATNIPYGPEKLHFNSTIEWRYFSLYFPPLPEDVSFFDLIEKEHGTDNDFNFYGIKLNDKERMSMIY